jgi:hypothetical protein
VGSEGKVSVYSFITVLGVCVLIGALSSVLDGDVALGRAGFVGGFALIVVSEWRRWLNKTPPSE